MKIKTVAKLKEYFQRLDVSRWIAILKSSGSLHSQIQHVYLLWAKKLLWPEGRNKLQEATEPSNLFWSWWKSLGHDLYLSKHTVWGLVMKRLMVYIRLRWILGRILSTELLRVGGRCHMSHWCFYSGWPSELSLEKNHKVLSITRARRLQWDLLSRCFSFWGFNKNSKSACW